MELKTDTEIERRFLYDSPLLPHTSDATRIKQGYFAIDKLNVARIRTKDTGAIKTAELCLKGPKIEWEAPEFEWDCSLSRAAALFSLCDGRMVDKIRHAVMHEGWTFEVDIFKGSLQPLVLVEVELATVHQEITLPDWVGEEVTHLGEYSNMRLAVHGLPQHYIDWCKKRNIVM